MKVNVETPSKIKGYTTLSPIDFREDYEDEPYDKDINIKISEYGVITINGEIMVMLKFIARHDQVIYCSYSDSKWVAETDEMIPTTPEGGISTSIGYYRGHGVPESDNNEVFDTIVDEYGDDHMWKKTSFKELFEDLIRGYTNSSGKYIWRKRIEKARKFIMDSFDEALNEYKDYEDNDDTED